MSTVKTNNVQIGQSVTATNNFTWYQPASPDGTVRLGNGNSGSVTDLVTLTSAGNLGIGTSSPGSKLTIAGSVSGSSAANGYDAYTATRASRSFCWGLDASGNYGIWDTTSGANNRLLIDSSGNLGLGVTPSSFSNGKAIQIIGTTFNDDNGGTFILAKNANYNSGFKYIASDYASAYLQYSGQHVWRTAPSGTAGNAISFTQAMTLDASGNLLVGTTSAPASRVGLVVRNAASTSSVGNFYNDSSTPYGCVVNFGTVSPNNNTNWFFYAADSTAGRFLVYSNGGIANYSANNTNLSDERVKTAITPAPSWLAKINAIEVVNFKYKDQTHDDPNLGVIAQQVLSVAPELVDEDGFGETPEDGIPLMAIFETDLKYAMLKAIQELSAQVSDLKTELNELKQKVNA